MTRPESDAERSARLRAARFRREHAAALTTAEAAITFAQAHPELLTPEFREATSAYQTFLTTETETTSA